MVCVIYLVQSMYVHLPNSDAPPGGPRRCSWMGPRIPNGDYHDDDDDWTSNPDPQGTRDNRKH